MRLSGREPEQESKYIAMRVVLLHNAVSPDDPPADRDVLVQAEAVSKALESLGHDWVTLPCTLDLAALRSHLEEVRPEVIFNLAESLGGSDSLAHLVTALLDAMGVPYSGSPTVAHFLTNHKLLAKQQLRQAGLPTPGWICSGPQPGRLPVEEEAATFSPSARYMLKTIGEHASFGLDEESIVQTDTLAALQARLANHAACLGRPCFAEEFIDGREFNLSVLAGPDGPEVLPPAEIDFSNFPAGKPRIVGYRAKWEDQSFEFTNTPRHFAYAPTERPLLDQLKAQAKVCWDVFGLGGYVRVDFRVDDSGRPWILEINTNPCLSPDAGFAAALAQAGIPFDRAVQRILADALK